MTWEPAPDDNGRLHASYRVCIRREFDGREVVVNEPLPWHSSSWFWWAQGNASCDCNRELTFRRALGEDPDVDSVACGDGAYLVLWFEFADGERLNGPDAPTNGA